MNRHRLHSALLTNLFLSVFFLSACSTELSECDGPQLNVSKLKGLRKTLFSGGPKANLVVPNPIDATNISSIQASDPTLSKEIEGFSLSNLISPKRLENAFLKVRIKDKEDDPSLLASPNSKGDYSFALTDVHYAETMAYYSIESITQYVEALGFKVVKSRPLYVMVRAEDSNGSSSPNALYTHNYLNPSLPRLMRLYGSGNFAPSIDRDMYWHEFGHLFNESVSSEIGMDFAADSGAIFTEASALHECLADYLAESVGNKGNIGKWIARNFSEIPAGEPLRSADKRDDEFNDFKSVSINDGNGANPERYRMAEWCTRVLWDLRSQFLKEDPNDGAIFSDRMIFSAASLLSKDTSISEFKKALAKSDEQLHCGLHHRSINAAFESRGFKSEVEDVGAKLSLEVSPVGISYSQDKYTIGSPKAGGELAFYFRVRNPGTNTARNVRVFLESSDPALYPTTYMQGFGDIAAGGSISVGQGGYPLEYSVYGTLDKSAKGKVRFRIRLKVENGADVVQEGDVSL